MLPVPSGQQTQDDNLLDEDSLFGSPPPPPARGRSPSLTLPETPLPASQVRGSGLSAQNVGTIALPGSHTFSEQPTNPLALSLSLPGGSCTPILPQSLPSPRQPLSRQGSVGRKGTSRPASRPRAQPSISPRPNSSQYRKQADKSRSKEPTPRPPGPEIPLPDPNQPPPPRFLRNQQALLGHAGLIARVKPAKLTTLCGNPRGASPSNPIVLDDDEGDPMTETPAIGRAHIDHLDPSKLPVPAYQEIIEILINQKDIFPVLQSISKLLASGALGGKTTTFVSNSVEHLRLDNSERTQPPKKRRKLHCVPAGAADWDVPYPFPEGEGPKAYKQNWAKERGGQLIWQLLGLVKTAVRKAASKKYFSELKQKQGEWDQLDKGQWKETAAMNQQGGGKGAKHYRDECQPNETAPIVTTHLDPVTNEQSQELVGNAVGDARSPTKFGSTELPEKPESAAATIAPVVPNVQVDPVPSTTPFDQLLSSLLAAASGQSSDATPLNLFSLSPLDSPQLHPAPQMPGGPLASIDSTLVSSYRDGDQALVDSWMNILQTFPGGLDEVDMTSSFLNDDPSSFSSPADSHPSSFTSTPNPDFQPMQAFPDLGQVQNFESNSILTTGELENDSPALGDILTSMDMTFGLPSSQGSMMDSMLLDAEPSTLSTSLAVAGVSLEPNVLQTTFHSQPETKDDCFIDPELLALSLPRPDSSALPSSGSTKLSTLGPHLTTNNDDLMARSPSSFVPSPMSSFDPATPSSAGWEMNVPEVVGGSSQDQGMWWDSFLASIGEANSGGEKDLHGDDLLKKLQEVQKEGDPTQSLVQAHTTIIFPRNEHTEAHTHEMENTVAQSTATSSGSPAPVTTAPAFQVLQAANWQPQEPVKRLKKSDVLERAEKRRKELQAELDHVKVKLWEATVEHGALIHLARLCGEAENSSTSDGVE